MQISKLGQVRVSHCVASTLLLTTSVNIWNRGDQLLDLWERIVSHSYLIEDSSCSAVLSLNVFRWRNIWTLQQLDSSATKPCCWSRCRMWFNFVLMKYARPSLKKGADVALKPVYTFQHWWSLSRCFSKDFFSVLLTFSAFCCSRPNFFPRQPWYLHTFFLASTAWKWPRLHWRSQSLY